MAHTHTHKKQAPIECFSFTSNSHFATWSCVHFLLLWVIFFTYNVRSNFHTHLKDNLYRNWLDLNLKSKFRFFIDKKYWISYSKLRLYRNETQANKYILCSREQNMLFFFVYLWKLVQTFTWINNLKVIKHASKNIEKKRKEKKSTIY